MSDSVRPHRRQPTRFPHPWDSPSKDTGVGCHFLLQCMKVKSESGVTQSYPTLSNPLHCSPPGSSVHGIFQARVLECTGHLIALQREEIHLPPPEHRHKFPNQETLISHWSNPTHREQTTQLRGAMTLQPAERGPQSAI